MLRVAKDLRGSAVHALDGEIGSIDELLFDDEHWTVRYLVVDTGSWLTGRRVLLSPLAFRHLSGGREPNVPLPLEVNLTMEQVKNSPGVETDKPVSRQWEALYHDYYAWPYYWNDVGMWGVWGSPAALALQPLETTEERKQEQNKEESNHSDEHLRSTYEVTGYTIHATDGDLGHVEDIIFDDEIWAIRYMAIDTRVWWPGKRVLLPPHWIKQVAWPDGIVNVELSRDQVRNAPEWRHHEPITRDYEELLHDYYGKQGYWDGDQQNGPSN